MHTARHFTSLYLLEPLLPVGVEGLQTALHLSRSRPTDLPLLRSIPLSAAYIAIISCHISFTRRTIL
jgi:hypothetical protein